MLVAERPRPDRVSVVSTVGIGRRRIRSRRAGAYVGRGGALIVLLVVVVFACFFEIGRATEARSTAPTESSSLPAASPRVAVLVQLSTVPAIETLRGASRPAPAPSSSQPASTPAFLSAQAPAPAVSSAHRLSPPPPSIVSTPQEAPAQQVHSAPPPAAPSTGGSSGSKGGAAKPSSGGGTFESSG